MTARNTHAMLGHYATCQVSYAVERRFTSRLFALNVEALHEAHHAAVEDNRNGDHDDYIEECDRAVLRLWQAEYGRPFVMESRASRPVTGAEAQCGIEDEDDSRRIDPPVMGLDSVREPA